MGAEIPRFGFPNRFFGLTTSCFFRDGIVNWFTIKLNNLDLIIVLLLRIELEASECQSGLLTSKLPRQYKGYLQCWHKGMFLKNSWAKKFLWIPPHLKSRDSRILRFGILFKNTNSGCLCPSQPKILSPGPRRRNPGGHSFSFGCRDLADGIQVCRCPS